MADVFLSYKREDARQVRKLVAALRQSGLETWWDEDIPPSAPWEATIEQELARARTVIVCWSPDAVASENVRSEARVAREDGRLIQVFLKPCSPPLFFGERQGIDLANWRGKTDDPRIVRTVETVRRVVAGEPLQQPGHLRHRKRFDRRLVAAVAALLLFVAGGTLWWRLGSRPEGPQTLAILPFRALNPADVNLVDAIWDDTRGAISHNPNLRVLGRQAVEVLAKQGLEPADYRKKVGADFLLDGNVQRSGDKVLMNVSLTRTNDGTEVWSDSIGGKLDDVFAFQQQIAREVEGRIRGRVAPGGGVKAQNIATTGEVYSIYAEARAKAKKRDHEDSIAAMSLLRKALALDPNYAPAWATLGQLAGMGVAGQEHREEMGVAYLRRALQLAPNLAHARAALVMVQNFPPELEGDIRKAVELDPNDAEAWGWLGTMLLNQNRPKDALDAYTHASNIEPLFVMPSVNKVVALADLGDAKGIEDEIRRVAATGDPILLGQVEAAAAGSTGHPGEQTRVLLKLRSAHPETASWVDGRIFNPLLGLGFIDEAARIWNLPADVPAAYKGTPESKAFLAEAYKKPLDMWLDDDAAAVYGRLLPANGRLQEYVGYYRAAFRGPEDFAAAYGHNPSKLATIVPVVAADLRAAGDRREADALLERADAIVAQSLKNGPPVPGLLWNLSAIRAAQGRDDEAVKLLGRAVALNWLPDRKFAATDIAQEPYFARLANRTDFQAIRSTIFRRIEQERAKIPLDLLERTYPPPMKAAA